MANVILNVAEVAVPIVIAYLKRKLNEKGPKGN